MIVQVRRTRWEPNRLDADGLEDHPELIAEHAGPIMNEIVAATHEPVQTVGHDTSLLKSDSRQLVS